MAHHQSRFLDHTYCHTRFTRRMVNLKWFTVYAAVKEAGAMNGHDASDSLETIPDAVPTVLTEPPIEEQLAWHTLWPESHKLYGHGNELFSVCCDHEGKLVASSCKVVNFSCT